MPTHKPITNGNNGHGRDNSGRFAAGNPGGPGNPHAQAVARLRAALYDAVTEADLQELVKSLLSKAREGNIAAARLVLEYCVGKPATIPEPEEIAALVDLERSKTTKILGNMIQDFVPPEKIPILTARIRFLAGEPVDSDSEAIGAAESVAVG